MTRAGVLKKLRICAQVWRWFEAVIKQKFKRHQGKRTERSLEEIAIEKCGFYLKPQARYDYLLNLPEKENIAKASLVRSRIGLIPLILKT